MRRTSVASRPDCLVCPLCEADELHTSDRTSMPCETCGGRLSRTMLEDLRRIGALPDALGSHACEECGHPEMRHLPDGIFHCPACGSEVLPIDVASTHSRSDEHGEAYWAGWVDGYSGEFASFVHNPHLAMWESPSERLAYYKGHRAGDEARCPSPDVPPEEGFASPPAPRRTVPRD